MKKKNYDTVNYVRSEYPHAWVLQIDRDFRLFIDKSATTPFVTATTEQAIWNKAKRKIEQLKSLA